ncbi:glycoside hydrolase family 16 protein [Streptomyces bohaiensis]|uniref:Family 16 glycosylhydrolase n=1 Tax=Streptomyces bohaiensis TaxID=1431344 RepID=A0ABX1C834_9ACTN|nr:glycoside hydrolase family 16 protein [Streptomyces bohaiensis]NJQ15315.1 family 16 glycosylhydrolase [Streptomyces bohaiensis]
MTGPRPARASSTASPHPGAERRRRLLRRPRLVVAALALSLGASLLASGATATALPDATAPSLTAAAPAVEPPSTQNVVFFDDFNGPAGAGVDSSKWTHEVGDNWGNNRESQYYTPGTRNAALDGNGNLAITARKENPNNYQCWYGRCEYTSARLNTAGKFNAQYGRVEARIKVPHGQGVWPAFWMLGADYANVGWPQTGEIDIMENVGFEPGRIHGTLHGPGYSAGGGIGASYTLPGGQRFADNFHVFAVDWSPNRISWSVNGTVYQTRTPADLGGRQWVFNKPFFLILNFAVGGEWPGYPDSSTQFPQQMLVDYVRVTEGQTPPPTGRTGTITGLAGKCVDVAGANTANGTPIQLHDCNGNAAQQWTIPGDGTLRAYGKCLDVDGPSTADGAAVHLWDCHGGASQQWAISGARDIVNIPANKCLDVRENNANNGTRLQIWTCSGNPNQKWNTP